VSGHGRSYNTYQIVPAEGGEPVPHTRVTDIAKTLDDRFFLEQWGKRMVAHGLTVRSDLYALASVTPLDEKGQLNRLCDDAIEAAKGSAQANMGTALHTLLERIDKGKLTTAAAPDAMWGDVMAYRKELRNVLDIVPEYVERVCVCADLDEPVAGTVDRIVLSADLQAQPLIADIKTGDNLSYQWRSIAIQLAIYAHSDTLYDKQTGEHEPMPAVRRDKGIVIHLPAGKATCTLYTVDLEAGWEAAKLAVAVRKWRKQTGLAEKLAA
jgi:hypothetical protein